MEGKLEILIPRTRKDVIHVLESLLGSTRNPQVIDKLAGWVFLFHSCSIYLNYIDRV